ncbi:MAG: TIGR01777 family oxidoreductase [Chloroflexota bacterium]
MRIIISGGTGVIGQALIAQLSTENHEIIVLSRNPAAQTSQPGVRIVGWGAKSAEGWGEWMDGADIVINLAGQPLSSGLIPTPWTADYKRKIEASRLEAGQGLVSAISAAAHKPSVLFQISGIDYYPYSDKVMTEDDPPGDSFLARVVADYWESSTAPVEEMGVRRVVGRMGPLLNLDNGPLPSSLLQFKLFVGGRLGSGKQWMSWIHIDDAVNAIRYLVGNEAARGVYNIAAPNPVTNADYTAALGSIMHRPTLIPVPEFAMRSVLGEVSDLVLKGRPVSVDKLMALGFRFDFPTIESALQDLLQ